MKVNLFLILFYLTNVVLIFGMGSALWEKFGKLRKKINKMLNKQQGKEYFLDLNEFEYPRTNKTFRNIHRQLWQEYYKCLKKRYADIGVQKTIYPIALIALEGTSVELKCGICISPAETYAIENIEWYLNSSAQNIFDTLIEETEHVLISPADRRLIMYNVQLKQTGQYWCKMGDMLSAPYYLSIDTDSEAIKIVHPNTAPNAPQATPEKIIPEYDLKIYTTWTKWSPCSTCDVVGKKNRHGYCTISIQGNRARRDIANQSIPEVEEEGDYRSQDEQAEVTTTKSKLIHKTSRNQLKTTLLVFRNRLPCKSKYIPKDIQEIPDIKNRMTEIMVRYCKKKCPKNVIFEVRDKHGNVLESANNSAGIYSMIQGMPMPSPSVVRTTVYQKHNKKLSLICPGNLDTDAPLIWKVGNKILNPSVVKDQSSGRIYINPQMHIIFKSLRFEDENIYSCWQTDQIAGIVKLTVTGEIELQMNHSIIMIGGISIVIVFLIVFWRAFRGRKRFTMH